MKRLRLKAIFFSQMTHDDEIVLIQKNKQCVHYDNVTDAKLDSQNY